MRRAAQRMISRSFGIGRSQFSRAGEVDGKTVVIIVLATVVGLSLIVCAGLVLLMLPAVQSARNAARVTQSQNNLKQIGLAFHNYHTAHDKLPFGSGYTIATTGTWAAMLLPQLEQQNLYDTFDFTKPPNHANNKDAIETRVAVYICPSDPGGRDHVLKSRINTENNPTACHGMWYPGSMGPIHDRYPGGTPYCVYCPGEADGTVMPSWCCQSENYGSGDGDFPGMFGRYPRSISFDEVRDGLSNTILCGETLPTHSIYNGAYMNNVPLSPTNIPLNTMLSDDGVDSPGAAGLHKWQHTLGYKSLHPGGAMFLLVDGSVHFFSESIDYQLYNALGTRSGGEVAQLP